MDSEISRADASVIGGEIGGVSAIVIGGVSAIVIGGVSAIVIDGVSGGASGGAFIIEIYIFIEYFFHAASVNTE